MELREFEDVRYEVDRGLAWITIARPERFNSFRGRTVDELVRAFKAAWTDPTVGVVALTGEGEQAFCAGGDQKQRNETGDYGPTETGLFEVETLHRVIREIPKPVIAAVNGVAAGGGLVLAAMCDVRFASTAASFTSVFTKRGLVAEHGTTWTIPRLVGVGRALDLLWTSRRIDAAEAARIGLVEYVVEPGELVAAASRYVAELAATVSPAALADTKRMVYAHLGQGYAEALPDADATAWRAIDRSDAREGAQALLEKRAARFARLGARPSH